MDSRIPSVIQPLLTDFLAQMDEQLPEFLMGFYIHGSIALDAFNPRSSDIDALAVLNRPASQADLETLRRIHQTVAEKYPKWLLEVSYLQPADLGRTQPPASAPYPLYHDNKLELSADFDQNAVTWWLLKHRGITVKGTPAGELPYHVETDTLIRWMKNNLNLYWATFTRKPARMAWLLSDYGIQWAVLGVLRQYYTFREHEITSKTGAGEYALTQLPARWHKLIREAMSIREESGTSTYQTTVGRALDALQFMRSIIQLCNTLADEPKDR
ncbi:MAG: DUF4111 domain-containing protein [Chloroflexi bacterium]|nr:DUF4111 domain-containing protein [Chloroflexota bacterium]MCC6895091.1 DUF4111 domain-containing protein [Anaerolineae bacterium]